MRLTNAISTCFAALAALFLTTEAQAITVDFVNVGDPGNANDTATGYGAVSYDYRIGKYEVTLHQYTAFLNAVAKTDAYDLYNTDLATDLNIKGIVRSGVSGSYSYSVFGDENRPVTYVNWFDAARFMNWLHNGQPSGLQTAATTEDGAYALNGITVGGLTISKNANARYWIPSENEWYKAAYCDPVNAGADANATTNYWLYPMQGDTQPNSRNGSVIDANSANFYYDDSIANGFNGGYAVTNSTSVPANNVLTAVGAFTQAGSHYGTFDQGGNVWEWNDAMINSSRGLRGGSWIYISTDLQSSSRSDYNPAGEAFVIGFRVATFPELPQAVLFQHTGSTDPALEGWQAIGSHNDATAGPVNDAGTPAWFSNDTSTAVGSYRYYFANVTNAQAASATSLGWTLAARVRVTAVSTTPIGSPYAGFANGPRTYSMFFAGRANGDVEVSLYGSGLSFTLAGGMSAYHDYSLVYDPVAGSADLLVDGVGRLGNYSGAADPQQLVDWGTGSNGYDGSANFNRVKFSVTRPLPFWRQLQGLSSDGSQDLASPSGDGIANLLKYAFNMAPNAGDLATPNLGVLPANGTAGLPAIGRDAQGRLVIEFVRRHAETTPGITYTVETGDDLANLQALSLTGATVVPINAMWERVTVTDPVVTGKRFGRVRVLASDP